MGWSRPLASKTGPVHVSTHKIPQNGVSILGGCQYHMTDDWKIEELVLMAEPFSDEAHTAEAIKAKTLNALKTAGYPLNDPFSGVFKLRLPRRLALSASSLRRGRCTMTCASRPRTTRSSTLSLQPSTPSRW